MSNKRNALRQTKAGRLAKKAHARMRDFLQAGGIIGKRHYGSRVPHFRDCMFMLYSKRAGKVLIGAANGTADIGAAWREARALCETMGKSTDGQKTE